VIPLFISQIKAGQPLTVTDPGMTRFLMNMEEAIDLVLFAFEHAQPGDLMVKKAPASTIGDLAEGLKKLFNADNEVRVIGVRMGEKIHETLLTREERAAAIDMGDFFRVPADTSDLNYAKYFSSGNRKVADMEEYSSNNTHRLNEAELEQVLLSCEYVARELADWRKT